MVSEQREKLFYIVNSIVCLALMLGFGHLQPIGSITPLGMDILGIFIGLIYGWSTVGTIWPSLVGILAMGFTDPVSYTHLDVYKRQEQEGVGLGLYLAREILRSQGGYIKAESLHDGRVRFSLYLLK